MRRRGKKRWRWIEWHVSDWLEFCFRFSDRFINIRRWVKLVSRLDAPDQNRRYFSFARVDEIRLSSNLNLCSNSNTMNRRKKIWQVQCERFQSSTHTYLLHHVSLNSIVSEFFAIVNQADCFPEENFHFRNSCFSSSWILIWDEKTNNPIDCCRVILVYVWWSILKNIHIERLKLSDYISHSVKQYVCVSYI